MTLALLGGTVVDGSGSPETRSDVLIDGSRIVSVGRLGDLGASVKRVDVSGMCVAPGFVDSHSHGDDAPFLANANRLKLLQGVTTEVVGNCGIGVAPRPAGAAREALQRFFPEVDWPGATMPEFLAETDRQRYSTNYIPLVPHGALRGSVAGMQREPLDGKQLAAEVAQLEEAFAAGAAGVSTGLTYPPGSFADATELVGLAEAAARHDLVYASHLRSEGRERLAALCEALDLARRTGVRLHISHHKAIGRAQWGTIERSLELVSEARGDGVRVTLDVYPYEASATTLTACLPPELAALDGDTLLDALADESGRDHLRRRLAASDWDNRILECGGPESVLVVSTPSGDHVGRTLADIAGDLHTGVADALATVLVEHRLTVGMVCFAMSLEDVERALLDEYTCIGSDSPADSSSRVAGGHPRGAGTFARILADAVRERRALTLAEAVRRMTSLPAEIFGLDDIGRIAAGYAADIVVFDPDTITDRATYRDPTTPATGVSSVFVNGQPAVIAGRVTEQRTGRRIAPHRHSTGSGG